MTTLADIPRVQARQLRDAKALVFKDKALTYLQLDAQSNRIANALLAQGIRPTSRVAILAKDSLKSYEILFACNKINAVLVPINWRLAAAEVSYILRDANVEVLFVGSQFQALVETIRNQLDGVKIFIALEKAEENWLTYDRWYQEHSDVQPDIAISPNDVAVQMYTSGTTGRPKGVQLAHYSFFAIAKEFVKQGKSWIGWSQADKSLLLLPFFHIGENISLLGDQFYLVALPWLTIQLTNSGVSVARISHKLEMQRGRGERTCTNLSPAPLLPCSPAQGFERCGEKSGVPVINNIDTLF